jgi:type IV secretory pathway TraG/TraD family ATPase VirD4
VAQLLQHARNCSEMALVIDPKGQNAAVTAAARGNGGGRVKNGMGQTVRIIDPFGELKAIATSRSGKGRSAIIPNLLTWPGSAARPGAGNPRCDEPGANPDRQGNPRRP